MGQAFPQQGAGQAVPQQGAGQAVPQQGAGQAVPGLGKPPSRAVSQRGAGQAVPQQGVGQAPPAGVQAGTPGGVSKQLMVKQAVPEKGVGLAIQIVHNIVSLEVGWLYARQNVGGSLSLNYERIKLAANIQYH